MNHFVLIHKKIEELQKEYTRKIVFQTFLHLQTPDFNSSINCDWNIYNEQEI